MSKDAPQAHDGQLSSNNQRRRVLLELISLLGIGGATFGGGALLSKVPSRHAESPNESNEEHHDMPKWLDVGTASGVAGLFAHHVLYRGAAKGIGLGPISAAHLNAAAFGRIGALYAFGGKEGAELAKEELGEIEHSLLPLPVLVALSDATTSELKVNSEAIFQHVEESLEGGERINYNNPPRPAFESTRENWQSYLETVNADLMEKTAQIAAITSVLAPLGTTYTSSSLANTLKEQVIKILYEQSYALCVIKIIDDNGGTEQLTGMSEEEIGRYDALIDKISAATENDEGKNEGHVKKINDILDPDELIFYRSAQERTGGAQVEAQRKNLTKRDTIEDEAITRADELMNGSMGFSKLMFTLAANTNGTCFIGDPPEIYFAINHHNAATMAYAHGIGALNSEAYTMMLNTAWLANAGLGVSSINFPATLLSSQKQVIESLIATIADGNLRDVSFFQGKKAVRRVINALNDENDPGGKLRQALNTIPEARLQFSLMKYLKGKLAALNGHARMVAAIPHAAIANANAFENHGEGYKMLWKMARGRVDGDSKKYHRALTEKVKTKEAVEMAALLESLMMIHSTELEQGEDDDKNTVADTNGKTTGNEETKQNKKSDHSAEVMIVVSSIMRKYEEMSEKNKEARVKRAFTRLRSPKKKGGPEIAIATFEDMRSVSDENIRLALAELVDIEPKEDTVPGLKNGVVPRETVAEAFAHKDSSIHVLSHSAKEVLWALLTQIPSVPAIARLVKITLPKLTGVTEGEKPNPEQLKSIVSWMMFLEAGMSAFADNVAAYLFAENVLRSFFIDSFGEGVLEYPTHMPGLNVEGMIGILSKMVAEQAGSMSQVGNGPNFSQKKVTLVKDSSRASGVSIDRTKEKMKIRMGETLPHKNFFSAFANGSLVLGVIGVLHKTIDKIVETQVANDNQPDKKQSENEGTAANNFRGRIGGFLDRWDREKSRSKQEGVA